MLTESQRHELASGAAVWGITLSSGQLDQFSRFAKLLEEWNQRINLTRIPSEEIIALQFLDSLSVFAAVELRSGNRLIDVGTGAGFPGLPLKIAQPDLKVTLLDSTRKRLTFLEHVIERLELSDISVLHARAEDAGRQLDRRERYDFAVSRAVAKMPVLAEWLMPFVKVGGFAVALKSAAVDSEIDDATAIIGRLGGKVDCVNELTLPGTKIARKIVVLKKLTHTPRTYPRFPGHSSKAQ